LSDVPIAFATSFSPNDDQRHSIDNLTFVEVLEPTTLAMLGTGLFGLGFVRRRKAA